MLCKTHQCSDDVHAATALQFSPSQQGAVRLSISCSADLVEGPSEVTWSTERCEKTLATDALRQRAGKLMFNLSFFCTITLPREGWLQEALIWGSAFPVSCLLQSASSKMVPTIAFVLRLPLRWTSIEHWQCLSVFTTCRPHTLN